MELKKDDVEKIIINQGFTGPQLKISEGFEYLVDDLNNSREIGPTKFMKSHKILIYHSNGKTDTVFTNGTIHKHFGWYKSDENLLEKYKINDH